MVQPTRPPANRFNAVARKLYNPLGFSKAYNFILYFIFGGALLGFTLARLQYLDFNGIFCNPNGSGAAPGECYYYTRSFYKIGIILHLAAILPASLLALLQFTPAIRHKALLFHRINGHAVILLVLSANAGALMIARHAFGGGLEVQAAIGLLAAATTLSLGLAYYNVERLQIEQHRAWMLRAWFYLGAIVTARIVLILAATVSTAQRDYFVARPCAQLAFIYADDSENATLTAHPDCAPYFTGANPQQFALVRADMNGGGAAGVGAALGNSFGVALWLALATHAVGVEVYLGLTPREHERLRNVSYQRQLEAGMRQPGRAGLTADRVGDAERWIPAAAAVGKVEEGEE